VTIEIGVLGHWLPQQQILQQQIFSLSKSTATQLLDSAAKAIVPTSHRIFSSSHLIRFILSSTFKLVSQFPIISGGLHISQTSWQEQKE